MTNCFKNYFKRVISGVNKWELVYWWILRALMIYALIDTIVNGNEQYKGSNPWQQVAANLVGMFAYEIMQLFPAKSKFRLFSPHFQNITALGFFLGSFGGAYMNLYYALPMYDKLLHAFGTAEGVYIGYEYVCAMQLKIRKTCPGRIAALAGTGFGFILATCWELFEFTYDQFFGGDAQHWNIENAIEQAGGIEKIFQMIPIHDMELFRQRFALMDTMCDTVMNIVGGIIMYVILIYFPYRHRGKNDINARIEAMNSEDAGK